MRQKRAANQGLLQLKTSIYMNFEKESKWKKNLLDLAHFLSLSTSGNKVNVIKIGGTLVFSI